MHYFGDPKWYFSKVKFTICISAFVLYCKKKLHANFHKKMLIFGPLEYFENENFDARATARSLRMRTEILELDF